jgi:hypothetical protein
METLNPFPKDGLKGTICAQVAVVKRPVAPENL